MIYDGVILRTRVSGIFQKCIHVIVMALPLLYIELAHAIVTSGTLMVFNSLGNMTANGVGKTASPIHIVVYDSTGVCSTFTSLAYGDVATIAWGGSHTTTNCSDLYQLDITPLATASGFIQYNQTATVTSATASVISFVPPTTAYASHLFVVAGNNPAGFTIGAPSPTQWSLLAGMSAPALPVYDTSNGALITTGIPGATVTSS